MSDRIITFDEATHTYTLNGKPAPSVTTILREVLGDHPAAIGTTEFHLQRGRAAHAIYAILGELAMEGHDLDMIRYKALNEWNIDPKLSPYIEGWLHWYSTFKGKIIGCEVRIASTIFGYVGTLDLVIEETKTSRLIVDFKQSASGRDTYQMGGYALGYNEAEKEKVNGIMAVQITGDGSFKMHKKSTKGQFLAAVRGWQSVLAVYRMKERGE